MQNIFSQQKILENSDNFTIFSNNINSTIENINLSNFQPTETASWIIFKIWTSFSKWWFSYIWTETLSWVYCESDSEDPETNNIFIKNFIPFEEQSEDIFTNYDDILISNIINISWIKFKSFQKENRIGTEILWNYNTNIIWKWVFWNKFIEWASWEDIYLNSPTWLTASWNILFISDTLNNRILYYNVTLDTIHLLLDESDWLNEPTWLYYNNNSLYIANSWNWEILKYSSNNIVINKNLNLSFSWITANNIDNIEIEFLTWSLNLNNPNDNSEKSDISFSANINKGSDYMSWTLNYIKYYFSDFSNVENLDWPKNIPLCNNDKNYYIEAWVIKEDNTVCSGTNTWTIIKSNWPLNTNFLSLNTYSIDISNITPLITNTWSHYINLKLFNWLNEISSKYFPYFIQADNDLLTINDNTLEIFTWWLIYPTWIWWTWNLDFNDFWNWWYINLPYKNTDKLLLPPINSLNITNTPNDLLSIILNYYKKYNCYNLDDNSERTLILKKNLK